MDLRIWGAQSNWMRRGMGGNDADFIPLYEILKIIKLKLEERSVQHTELAEVAQSPPSAFVPSWVV